LGVTGLVLFLAMIAAAFLAMARIRAAMNGHADEDIYRPLANGMDGAMVGFIVSGFFVTVLFYPYFWVQLAFTVSLYGIVTSQDDRPIRRRLSMKVHGEQNAT